MLLLRCKDIDTKPEQSSWYEPPSGPLVKAPEV
jgi:hypothetical protein